MGKKLSSSDEVSPTSSAYIANSISRLAFGKCNDAVRLVFLDAEQQELIGELDLSMVSEVKRCSNGQIEVKLLDRLSLLELLSTIMKPEVPKGSEAASFFSAMDKAASRLSGSEDGA